MALVEVAECDICQSKYKVTKWLTLVMEETPQLNFDFVKTADRILAAGTVVFFCPKHLKRFCHFNRRGMTAPTPKKKALRRNECRS